MNGLVALTGASGFLGRHILSRLRGDGWRLRVLARRPSALDAGRDIEVVEGDLADRDALARLVADAEVVVHCAGLTHGGRPAAFHAVNTVGTARLVAAAAAAPAPPRFVLISSIAARAPTISPYAASKRAAEDALSQLGRDLDWAVLRPAAVYGPGDSANLPLFKLFERGLAPVPWPARHGNERVSLIYVEDLAAAVAGMLAAAPFDRRICELGDPEPGGHTWRAIAENGGRALGTRVRRIPVPFGAMALLAGVNLVFRRLLGGSALVTPGKIREIFHPDWGVAEGTLGRHVGWRPEVTIGEGFARTARWYRQQSLL